MRYIILKRNNYNISTELNSLLQRKWSPKWEERFQPNQKAKERESSYGSGTLFAETAQSLAK